MKLTYMMSKCSSKKNNMKGCFSYMKEELLNRYLFAKAYELEIPISATLELLDMCNLRCEHCYLPEHANFGMSTEQVKSILNDLRMAGVLTVTLTGGEIFVRKDIFDIIEYARDLNMRVILLTNATLLDEEKIIKLKNLYVTQVSTSMFSLNADRHDSITCVKGSLDMLMKNLKLLKEYGVDVQVKTPLMEKNKFDYKAIGQFCKENSFAYKFSARIFSKNDGDASPKDLKVSLPNLSKIICDYDENEGKELFTTDVTCGALKYSLSIDRKGDVFPCNSYPVCVGNVFKNSIIDIWNSKEYKNIRNIKHTDLVSCMKCNLRDYCKRCPAMAYRDTGNYYACDEDAKCWAVCRKEKALIIEK